MPSASFSTSSQLKSKLHTQLYKGKPVGDVQHDDKENISFEVPKLISIVGSQKLHDGDLPKSSPQLPALPSLKPCPQTPANRIPLADLIGNTEDAFNCAPKDTTPEDHVYWQHAPTPGRSVPSATARKGTKRARSSSPATPSQKPKSSHFDPQGTIDLKTLPESLKTPHNDPAFDLWTRYTDASGTNNDPEGKPLPMFAHLLNSSPQTLGSTNGKDGGLRRSISCGIEWPASKAKRRKYNDEIADGRSKAMFAATKPQITASGKSKASRIALLMEKLQENSRRVPQIEISGPSSSSPLPDLNYFSNTPMLSPLSKRTAAQQEDSESITKEDDHQLRHDVPVQQEPEEQDNPLSEFGDEDLALDVLEAVEQASCTQAALPAADNESLGTTNGVVDQGYGKCSGQHGDLRAVYSSAAAVMREASQSRVQGNVKPFSDVLPGAFDGDDDEEFGGGADDIGVMADLAAQFDTQGSTCSPHPPVEQVLMQQAGGYKSGRTPSQATNDDGYDEDYDDDLWNCIGDGSTMLSQDNCVATGSQVRAIL